MRLTGGKCGGSGQAEAASPVPATVTTTPPLRVTVGDLTLTGKPDHWQQLAKMRQPAGQQSPAHAPEPTYEAALAAAARVRSACPTVSCVRSLLGDVIR